MALEDLYKHFTGISVPDSINMLDSLVNTRWNMEVSL